MQRALRFSTNARETLAALEADAHAAGILKQVRKTLGLLEINLRHPSLNSHKFSSMQGASGEEVFEAYAQNNTPGAYRVGGVNVRFGRGRSKKDARARLLRIAGAG